MVHRAAKTGFNRAADAYERGRPTYPPYAISWLQQRLSGTIVDLAAGTGKLTRLLTSSRLVAVEPVAGMRRELARLVPEAFAIAGTAEAIPLRSGSVDAVTVAQAFHWFDGTRAVPEIRRVLRHPGLLAVVYNNRVDDAAVNAAMSQIIEPYLGDAPSRRTGKWREALDATDLFALAEDASFPNVQTTDAAGLVDRVLSTSVIASLDVKERTKVAKQVRALAKRLGGTVRVPYVTEITLWRAVERFRATG